MAIIVLSGREPLSRHVDGGIKISGSITKPILYSVFDPSSARLDGAIVIERDRIEKFGAHLPISKNHQEICGRGTRHSAALGIFECSDSLTFVVSEERGSVIIAQEGKLIEMKTASDLKARIDCFLEDRFPQKVESPWKRLIMHDFHLKLLTLLLAVFAWFVLVYSVETLETSIVVPIEYRNLPEHTRIDESTPAEALVTISGAERA